MAGRYAEAAALGEEAARIGTLAGDANAARNAWIQATAILFEQERYDELEEGPALAALESSAVPGAWHSGLAWVFAARGETERGRHHLDAIARDGWALLPRDANHLACLHECARLPPTWATPAAAPSSSRCSRPTRAAASSTPAPSTRTRAGPTRSAAPRRPRATYVAAAEHLARAVEHNRALGAEPRAALAERRLREL